MQKLEKAEASDRSTARMKQLATQGAAFDTKHAGEAKELAAAHDMQLMLHAFLKLPVVSLLSVGQRPD